MMPMYLRNCSDERYLEALTKPSRATKPWEVLTDAIRSITNPRAFMGSACGFASGIGFNRLRRVIPSQKWILFAHQVHLAWPPAVFREIAEVRGLSAGKISVTRKIKRGAQWRNTGERRCKSSLICFLVI